MNLSPSDMKNLLYHILSGKEFGVEKSGECLSRVVRAFLGKAGGWCGVGPSPRVPSYVGCACPVCSAQLLVLCSGPVRSCTLQQGDAEPVSGDQA